MSKYYYGRMVVRCPSGIPIVFTHMGRFADGNGHQLFSKAFLIPDIGPQFLKHSFFSPIFFALLVPSHTPIFLCPSSSFAPHLLSHAFWAFRADAWRRRSRPESGHRGGTRPAAGTLAGPRIGCRGPRRPARLTGTRPQHSKAPQPPSQAQIRPFPGPVWLLTPTRPATARKRKGTARGRSQWTKHPRRLDIMTKVRSQNRKPLFMRHFGHWHRQRNGRFRSQYDLTRW